jgi:IS30 family transposase
MVIHPLGVKHTKFDGTPVEEKPCPSLLQAPFVCNPCQKSKRNCGYQKQFYVAKNAHTEYRTLLRESREGIPLNKEEFWEADSIIKEGFKKGQRLYHIMESNNISFSKSSAYRHLHRGYLSVHKLDFPRVVKFKTRKQRRSDSIPKAIREGRKYDDFIDFIEEHGITSWVEMDTVIGRIGGKVIMTFDFTFCNFMFGLLLDDKTAAEAAMKICALKARMRKKKVRFGDVMPVLLTDNGGEFANVFAFIHDSKGKEETKLFFCDPCQSFQKPKVEKNHTLFRDIVPKGESFDHFTQDCVNLIFSHVNGVKRKIFYGKSPYEMFAFTFGEAVTTLLGIKEIPANQVIQSPILLKNLPKSTHIPKRRGGTGTADHSEGRILLNA